MLKKRERPKSRKCPIEPKDLSRLSHPTPSPPSRMDPPRLVIEPQVRIIPRDQKEYIGVVIVATSQLRDYSDLLHAPPYSMNEQGHTRISLGTRLVCEGALQGILIPLAVTHLDWPRNRAFVVCQIRRTKEEVMINFRPDTLRWEVRRLRMPGEPEPESQSLQRTPPRHNSVALPDQLGIKEREQAAHYLSGRAPRFPSWEESSRQIDEKIMFHWRWPGKTDRPAQKTLWAAQKQRRAPEKLDIRVDSEVQTWTPQVNPDQTAKDAVTQGILDAAPPFSPPPSTPTMPTGTPSTYPPARLRCWNFTVPPARSALISKFSAHSPNHDDYEDLTLTDQVQFPRPTQEEVREYNRQHCTAEKSAVPIVLTSVEEGPNELKRRATTIGHPPQLLHVGEVVEAVGTLKGYWVLARRRFCMNGQVYLEWVDYVGKRKVVVCTPAEFMGPTGDVRARTKSLFRAISLPRLKGT
ncbi:hypothetical protein DFH09DRAFT_1093958 [Mycena vulgaris]|nr:hypothetical protein DFH09DRAFT_1093958 [Mycena vulgaris]